MAAVVSEMMPRFKFYASPKNLDKIARELGQMSEVPVYHGVTFVEADVGYAEAGMVARKYNARVDETHENLLSLKGWIR